MRYYPKSLHSHNPIPRGCVLYVPLWHPNLQHPTFKSIDPFGHECVSAGGVTYDSKSTIYNGTTGITTVTDHASMLDLFATGASVVIWLYPHSDGEGDNGVFFSKAASRFLCVTAGEDTGKVDIRFYVAFSTAAGDWITTATTLTINTWSFVVITYNGSNIANNPIFYWGTPTAAMTTLTVGSGITETTAPNGTIKDDTGDLYVGNRNATDLSYDGGIGDAGYYNRILSAAEAEYWRRETCGRY